MGELKSTWSSVELNLLLCAFILVKSGCFTDRETLQLATRMGFEPTRAKVCHIVWITMLYKKNFHRHLTSIAVTDPGEGASPIFFRLNWDPKGPKKCFWDPPPSLGLDERSLLSEGLGPDLDGISLDWSYPFFQETWTFAKELLLAAYHGPLLYSDLGHLIIEAQKDGLIFSTCFWSIWWHESPKVINAGGQKPACIKLT